MTDAPTCRTCRHYATNDAYPPRRGYCNLEMPPWIAVAYKNDKWGGIPAVRDSDFCSFHQGNPK
jgi:hypothetical protein